MITKNQIAQHRPDSIETERQIRKLLWCEGAGVSIIIALSWLNETTHLPGLFGCGSYIPNLSEAVVETVIVLAVAIPVMILSKRLVSRLHYLSGFLRVCAWCKHLSYQDKWMPLEEFFEHRFQTATSHGICQNCINQQPVPPRRNNRTT